MSEIPSTPEQQHFLAFAELDQWIIPPQDFERLYQNAMLQMEATQGHLPYHNHEHAADVTTRTIAILAETDIDDETKALTIVAALFHDFEHPGFPIRQTADFNIENKDMSNEEHAAHRAVEELMHTGLNIPLERVLTLVDLIHATSFGQSDPSSEYYRDYAPITEAEHVLAFADVANFGLDYEEWIWTFFEIYREWGKNIADINIRNFLQEALEFADEFQRDKLYAINGIVSDEFYAAQLLSLDRLVANIRGDLERQSTQQTSQAQNVQAQHIETYSQANLE